MSPRGRSSRNGAGARAISEEGSKWLVGRGAPDRKMRAVVKGSVREAPHPDIQDETEGEE